MAKALVLSDETLAEPVAPPRAAQPTPAPPEIWPHKNGTGFDLVLTDQISVSGRIVCTERKEKAAEQAAA
jgi:hypothetical protein